jgi:hypothetical protein
MRRFLHASRSSARIFSSSGVRLAASQRTSPGRRAPSAGKVTAEVSTDESAQASELSDNELYQPRPVPGLTSGPVNPKEQPNTLEMTRTILKNAGGEEKSVDELRHLIRTTYGIEPAKSLDQML